jgi:hypothetical protein
MAHAWFDILSFMSDRDQASIKKELNGKTLIGEYVGNQEY